MRGTDSSSQAACETGRHLSWELIASMSFVGDVHIHQQVPFSFPPRPLTTSGDELSVIPATALDSNDENDGDES